MLSNRFHFGNRGVKAGNVILFKKEEDVSHINVTELNAMFGFEVRAVRSRDQD